MSTTVRGMVIILVVGLIILLIAALADRRTRLRLERERPPGAPSDGGEAPAYVTDDQLAASFLRLAVAPDAALLDETMRQGTRLDLRLPDPGLANVTGGRSLLDRPALVLVCRDEVRTTRELLGVLGRAGTGGLILGAPGYDAEVVSTLVANLRAGTVRVQALVGRSGELARLAGLTGAAIVARTDLQADDVPDSRLGHAARSLADGRHAWIEAGPASAGTASVPPA